MPNFRRRLSRSQRVVYDKSDTKTSLPLRVTDRLVRAVNLLPVALSGEYASDAEHRRKVGKVAQVICDEICRGMGVDSPQVIVKGVRPIRRSDEYHGLYESDGASHQITVWMYTAKRRQAVAPRTLLRTLVHEVLHHLDYHKLGLVESFHTEGFFKRESSLVGQIERAVAKVARGPASGGPIRLPPLLEVESPRADDVGKVGRNDARDHR